MSLLSEQFATKLKEHCYKSGLDAQQQYYNWVQWCTDKMCELETYGDLDALKKHFNSMRLDNPFFLDLFKDWMYMTFEDLSNGECVDYFGRIYEYHFKTHTKAKDTGQFFTPIHVCDMMAKLVNDDSVGYLDFLDTCCGSGRMSISQWQNTNHKNHPYAWFENSDIDPVSVNMCALNMMFFGMIGCVSRKDGLTDTWWGGYIVNASKVPVLDYSISLRYYDDQKQFDAECNRLKDFMKDFYKQKQL